MGIALVTGAAGLIGSETCKRFHAEGLDIVGIDNDMRARFFGAEASTEKNRIKLEKALSCYTHDLLRISSSLLPAMICSLKELVPANLLISPICLLRL